MPIRVTDLKPGDRVVLNCPMARVPHRTAQFEGVYPSAAEAARTVAAGHDLTILAGKEFPAEGRHAVFLLSTVGSQELRGSFAVTPDGNLQDDDGRTIYVEQRLGRPNQG